MPMSTQNSTEKHLPIESAHDSGLTYSFSLDKLIPIHGIPNLGLSFSDLNQHQVETFVHKQVVYVHRKDINRILKKKHAEKQSKLPDLNSLFLEALNDWYSNHLHLFNDYNEQQCRLVLHH